MSITQGNLIENLIQRPRDSMVFDLKKYDKFWNSFPPCNFTKHILPISEDSFKYFTFIAVYYNELIFPASYRRDFAQWNCAENASKCVVSNFVKKCFPRQFHQVYMPLVSEGWFDPWVIQFHWNILNWTYI